MSGPGGEGWLGGLGKLCGVAAGGQSGPGPSVEPEPGVLDCGEAVGGGVVEG
jgi:hypothetical protein